MSPLRLKPHRSRLEASHHRALAVGIGLAGGGLVAQLALSSPTAGDYSSRAPVAGDNAGPAIDALIHGHLSSFIAHQPLMGLASIILRAPLAGLAEMLGGGSRLVYGLGALACLLPAVLLATWMIGRYGLSKQQRLAAAIAAVIMLIGPATAEGVKVGHPEELLAATLATGAVLAASRGRSNWAWPLLGLAVGTKQWALLAAPCVVLALPDRKLATAAKAGALALALSMALPLADPVAFARADSIVGGLSFADPSSLWWPIGHPVTTLTHVPFAPTAHLLPGGITRSAAAASGLVIALGSIWLYWSRKADRKAPVDALALLALCGLARCVTDPDPLQYNFVALLIPLAAWEAVELGRIPLVTALAAGTAALLAGRSGALSAGATVHMTPALASALSITWTLLLGIYLARRVIQARTHSGFAEFRQVVPTWIQQGG